MAEPKEIDFEEYRTKGPTSLQRRFAVWIAENCEVEFGTKKEEAAFREGVRLAVALRIPFQRSPENREATQEEREQRISESPRAVANDESETKPRRRKAAPAEETPEPAEEKAVKAAPRRRRATTAAAF